MTEPRDPFGHLEPWDRQPGESAKAYANFIVYRDLGKARTIKKAAEALKRTVGHVHNVSAINEWVERAAAWDRAEDAEWVLQMAVQRKEMASRHARVANAFMAKVVTRLNGIDPATLTAGDLVRFADLAVKIERLALGAAVEKVEGSGEPLEQLSEGERHERLIELNAEITRRLEEAGRSNPR